MAYGARPVPQNIMSVEFKIFDFMTLKQFGISVALLLLCFGLFSLFPTPWNIVVPLFIIVIGGIVIFVPFNGEPFQEFLSSYMEAMISPQRRVWNKRGIVVKSAAEKAKFYRYGNDPVPEDDNKFKFVDQNQINIAEQSNQLDKVEQQFLSQQNKEEVVPIQNNIQTNPVQNNSGTTISPKTLQNSMNIQQFQTQPTQQVISEQVSVNNARSSAESSSPIVNPQTQPNIVTNQSTTPQPTYIKKENEAQAQQNPKPKVDYEAEESAVKNFIFGSVEDYKDQPVKQAAVILKDKQGNNIEVLYTNIVGEFKTNYEYKADEYILYVNADSKDFNEIKILHEPIDPQPITIRPKDYEQKKKAIVEEEELLTTDTNDDGIFEGAYDSKVFNLGQDYLEDTKTNTEPQLPNYQQESTQEVAPQRPIEEITNLNQVKPEGGNIVHSAYTSQASNMFDQMMGGRVVNDYSVSSDQLPVESTQNSEESSVSSNQPSAQSSGTSTPVSNDVDFYNFSEMPNANVPFENNLVTLPNTINGILVGPNGYGLPDSQIRIFDTNSQLITSMQSDQTGRFYSYSPLPNGNYRAYISKNNQNLVGFDIVLDGKTIPPKYINFSY